VDHSHTLTHSTAEWSGLPCGKDPLTFSDTSCLSCTHHNVIYFINQSRFSVETCTRYFELDTISKLMRFSAVLC